MKKKISTDKPSITTTAAEEPLGIDLPSHSELVGLAATLAAHGKPSQEAVNQALDIWRMAREKIASEIERVSTDEELKQIAIQADLINGVSNEEPEIFTVKQAMDQTGYKLDSAFRKILAEARRRLHLPVNPESNTETLKRLQTKGFPEWFVNSIRFDEVITKQEIEKINRIRKEDDRKNAAKRQSRAREKGSK